MHAKGQCLTLQRLALTGQAESLRASSKAARVMLKRWVFQTGCGVSLLWGAIVLIALK